MLDRCDRVQIAVRDAAKAAAHYGELLGCQIARRDSSRHLAAKRTILAVGESEFELCEADGAGLTQDFLGTLTLFDPPNRLDRIELSQVTDNIQSMGRFAHKHGDSLYMCYIETHDWPAVRDRLLAASARYTPRGSDPTTDPDGGWVHPKELHGLLLGISRTGLAWEWSGREDLVPAA